MGRWKKAGIVQLSLLASLLLIVTANLAFLVTYEFNVSMQYYARKTSISWYRVNISIRLLVEGTIASLFVTFGWRVLFGVSRELGRSFERRALAVNDRARRTGDEIISGQ